MDWHLNFLKSKSYPSVINFEIIIYKKPANIELINEKNSNKVFKLDKINVLALANTVLPSASSFVSLSSLVIYLNISSICINNKKLETWEKRVNIFGGARSLICVLNVTKV